MHQAGYHTIRIILYFVYIMQQNKNKYPTSIDNRCAPTEVYSNTTCHWSLSTASSCMLAAVELVSCLYGFICSKSCCHTLISLSQMLSFGLEYHAKLSAYLHHIAHNATCTLCISPLVSGRINILSSCC